MTVSFGGKPVFPPPWTADEAGPAVFMRTEFGNLVCVVRAENGMSLARGTAAHIVKCVNERDEIVAALKECADRFELCCKASGSDASHAAVAVSGYRSILAKVTS